MKTGKLAQLLGGISPQTVNNWSDRPELEPFLSSAARKVGVSQRDYDANDRVVLNTVRQLRQDDSNISWEEIAAKLTGNHREVRFPATATTVDGIVPMEVMTSSAMAIVERDHALAQVNELRHDLVTAHTRIEEIQAQLAEMKAMETAQKRQVDAVEAENAALQKLIRKLERENAVLQFRLGEFGDGDE